MGDDGILSIVTLLEASFGGPFTTKPFSIEFVLLRWCLVTASWLFGGLVRERVPYYLILLLTTRNQNFLGGQLIFWQSMLTRQVTMS